MYDRNILGSPSVVFGNLRKSSENLRKCSETFVWPSEESGRKSSENRHILYNKKKITWLRGDTKFILSCRKIFQHSTINFFSPRGHVISSISLPSPPSEIQLKNKTETGDGSGYTLVRKPRRDNPKIFCKSKKIFEIAIFFSNHCRKV